MKALRYLLAGVFTAIAILMIVSIISSTVVAKSSDTPPEVVAAESTFQTTLTAYNLAQEAEAQVVAARMEAGVAHCMAWKTLAYAKWNAGIEISTSIDEVERTLCLSSF